MQEAQTHLGILIQGMWGMEAETLLFISQVILEVSTLTDLKETLSPSGSRKERFFYKFEHDNITFPNNAGAPTSFINNRSSVSPMNVYKGHRGWLRSR